MNDLIAGHVQMFFDLMPVVLPQVAAGKVRALANAGAKRPSALADVPTVAEQGLVGFDASSWYGLVAPAKTPEPVLAKLRGEVAKALEAPDMVARIRERPRSRRTAEKRDEFAPFHYPMPPVLPTERIAHSVVQETYCAARFGEGLWQLRGKLCRLEISAARPLYP